MTINNGQGKVNAMYGVKHAAVPDLGNYPPPEMAPVWDIPLRLFHWSTVCAVALAAITG